jgi:hypothetical protein
VDVRGEPSLWLDDGEVLQVVAEVAAKVLDKPVKERGEVDRVACGPLVVIASGVGRRAVGVDPAVGVAGQGDEHRRLPRRAIRPGVGHADRPARARFGRQVGCVLPSPGGPVPPGRAVGQHVAAYPGVGHLGVEFGGQFVEVGRVLPGLVGVVAELLCFAAQHGPPLLRLVGLVGVEGRFGVQVPAFAALGGA